MDWFERITGFKEENYLDTRRQLEMADGVLRSTVNGRCYRVGDLELVSLQALRERVGAAAGRLSPTLSGRLTVRIVRGDVRAMHRAPEHRDALFQVASQFNLLEMPGPGVTPEHGVTAYQHDKTQGPACAMAAGAATIYRNYFAPVGGQVGQAHDRQIDALAEMGNALSAAVGMPVAALWSMRNGYALCSRSGLDHINEHLASLDEEAIDALRGVLRIGVHGGVEVTDHADYASTRVSQAFCSALPVAYGSVPAAYWESFATLVLEASYEATLWAAVLNALTTGSRVVLLTCVGGGVFGNDAVWIDTAMRRAFERARQFNLDVRLVSYGEPSSALERLARDFS